MVDLFIELVILIGCPLIGRCRPCAELLKFLIDILMEKWNTIKFIKFEKALKRARGIKSDVAIQVLLDHYIVNKPFIKKCV